MDEENEKIKQLELEILEKKNILNKSKKSMELSILNKTTDLEKSYKETKNIDLSNAEKRNNIAMKEPAIYKLSEDLERLDYEIKVMEIEVRYLIRKFQMFMVEL
jgi:hypothetical protein